MEQFRSLAARVTAAPVHREMDQPVDLADSRSAHPAAADAGTGHSGATRANAGGMDHGQGSGADEALTEKESRILDLIAQGRSNKQIAAAVFLAEGTVKNYVSRIMDKLHAGSRIELAVRAAARRG
jgi:DNA-binding NarL/FixJ family response regulator